MNYQLRVALPVFLSVLFLAPLSASAGEIYSRSDRQEHRIVAGVADHQISPGELRNLEADELAIDSQRLADLTADRGHLTGYDATQLNHRLDNVSWLIYRDRHNQ